MDIDSYARMIDPRAFDEEGYPYQTALREGRRNIARDVVRAIVESVRTATIDECAQILDDCANDWNRIRDPGMANNARSYARKIRALSIDALEKTAHPIDNTDAEQIERLNARICELLREKAALERAAGKV